MTMFAVKQAAIYLVGLTNNAGKTPDNNPEVGQVCIANISPYERRKRLNFGFMMTAISLIALVVLMATGANHWWRLGLFLLFSSAATGFFQWQDKTCIAFARQNARKLGDQLEKIEDESELAQIRKQATRIQIKAVLVGLLFTAIVLLLP
jgi:hypothetical protein